MMFTKEFGMCTVLMFLEKYLLEIIFDLVCKRLTSTVYFSEICIFFLLIKPCCDLFLIWISF